MSLSWRIYSRNLSWPRRCRTIPLSPLPNFCYMTCSWFTVFRSKSSPTMAGISLPLSMKHWWNWADTVMSRQVPTTPKPMANANVTTRPWVPNLVALSNQSRSNWDLKLSPTTFNYDATKHDSTGFTPFHLMFARASRFVLDLPSPMVAQPIAQQYVPLMRDFIQHGTIAARANIVHHQRVAKLRYDRHRSNPIHSIGQTVLIRNHAISMNKFSPRFIGPYTIVKQLHDKLYLVQHYRSVTQTRVLVSDIRPI